MGKRKSTKKLIFVLGGVDPGVSLIAECISGLKYDPGKSVLTSSALNPMDGFINSTIKELNHQILADHNLTEETIICDHWDELSEERINKYRESFENILKEEFSKKKKILIYDYRTSFLLPYWNKIIDKEKFDVSYIIAIHSPRITTNSIEVEETRSAKNLQLRWLNAYFSSEKYTRDHERYFINIEDFRKSPFDSIYDVSRHLKLGLSSKSKSYAAFVEKLLKSNPQDFVEINDTFSSDRLKQFTDKLYSKLKNLNTAKTESSLKEIDTLRNNYNAVAKDFTASGIYPVKISARLLATDSNDKTHFQSHTVTNGQQLIRFKLESDLGYKKIHISPSNEVSYLKLDSIQLNNNSITNYKKEGILLEHGNLYILNKNSFFEIDLDSNQSTLNVTLDVEYFSFGLTVFKNIPIIQSRINQWIQKQHEGFNAEIQKLEKEAQALEGEAVEYEHTIKELTAHLEKHESLMEKYTVNKARWEELFSETNNRAIDSSPAEALIEKKKQQSDKISSLKEKLKGLKKELNEKDKKFLEFKDAHSKDLNQKTVRIAETKLKLEFLSEKNDELEEKLAKSAGEIKSLSKKLKSKSRKIEKLKETILEKQFEKEKLGYQVKLNFEKIDELNERVGLLNEQNETIIKESYQFLEEANQKNYLIEEKDQALDQMQQQYIEEMNRKNQTIEEREAELNRLASKMTELTHRLESVENEKEELANNTEPSDEVQRKIREKEEIIDELYRDIEEVKAESRLYEEELSNKEREFEELRESISFKIGKGLTLPLRWVYDKSSGGKPINQSRVWLLQQMFKSGIKNPAKTAKSLSPKNIKTLATALKNEPPHVIAENLNRLLDDQKSEDLQNLPEPGENRQKVLFISPNLPDFDTSSGGRRATRMLELMAQEFEVYAFTLGAQPEKYIQKLNDLGVIVLRTRNYHRIKKKITHFNAIIYAWYYTFFDANKFTELYPSAKVILDSVDVHWVREERSLGIWENLTEEDVRRNKKREVEAYKNADVIWAVTENDKENILNELPQSDVRVVSNIHDIHKEEYIDSGNKNMLFFGGFNHYPNISAAKMIVSKILPLVRSRHPDANLIIAGANAPDEIVELGNLEGVDYRGFIEEEELDNLYEDSFAAVAPLLAGAGIKGKICEAIAYSLPVFTNSIGNEGINLETEKDGFISDDAEELAEMISNAMDRKYNMSEITSHAQHKLKLIVGPEGVKNNMVSSIMPEVSICIVTWNRIDLVRRCIESIEGNTDYPHYKILVHSNGCEDGTQDYLKAASELNPRIVPILSPDNEVFVKPNNAMMQMFPNNDVVLVNNDVYVTKGWLKALVNAAYSDSEIGIAGSKILYPDEKLQEFGSELYADGTGRNIGKWDDPNKDEYKHMRRVGYVSGCSMYIKRSTINQIGVFDEQFHPCYCEDSDLCYTAWENGIETVVTPQSIIYHDEGGTSGTDEDSGFKAYQKVNFEKFLKKHKKNLGSIQQKIESLN